jgi:hypothetical protein
MSDEEGEKYHAAAPTGATEAMDHPGVAENSV